MSRWIDGIAKETVPTMNSSRHRIETAERMECWWLFIQKLTTYLVLYFHHNTPLGELLNNARIQLKKFTDRRNGHCTDFFIQVSEIIYAVHCGEECTDHALQAEHEFYWMIQYSDNTKLSQIVTLFVDRLVRLIYAVHNREKYKALYKALRLLGWVLVREI